MAKRLHLRAGEVPALFGLDSTLSEWALHERLTAGEDPGMGEYGRWQARLMVPIMQGICADHSLRTLGELDPHGTDFPAILPGRGWRLEPRTGVTSGERAVLVVAQRTGASLREWKEPSGLPEKSRVRYEAVATAYDADCVVVGLLVDGYGTRLFSVHVTPERRAEIRDRCTAFLADVAAGNEPDIDFADDERAIRSGVAVAKVEAAAEVVDALIKEKREIAGALPPIEVRVRTAQARIREIDTNLIHLAGRDGKLETPAHLVTIQRDGKNLPRVSIVDKQAKALF